MLCKSHLLHPGNEVPCNLWNVFYGTHKSNPIIIILYIKQKKAGHQLRLAQEVLSRSMFEVWSFLEVWYVPSSDFAFGTGFEVRTFDGDYLRRISMIEKVREVQSSVLPSSEFLWFSIQH